MASERLTELITELEASGVDTRGVDVRALTEIRDELEVIERPPGLVAGLTARVRGIAKTQWSHMLGELGESREMLRLLRRGLSSEQDPLTPEEQAAVRAQMQDMVRAVPAGFIAATNYCLPLPGTSLVTPWLLARLGLMPSRWREAHVLDRLRKERERLGAGHAGAAALLELERTIEAEADARTDAAAAAALLTHWDANGNGRWDHDERSAYEAELERLRVVARSQGAASRWFLQGEEQVFGPVPLTRLLGVELQLELLACYDGKSGWVELAPLLEVL